jgi:hypothetical protein
MPTYFPQLTAQGVMVQRPYATTLEHLTTHVDQPSGPRYGYSWRTEPLGRWDLQYALLTDAEVAVLEGFFTQMDGRYGEFTYLDPGGNLVRYSEDFSHSSWEKYTASVGGATSDPFGGNRATVVTGTSGNSMLAAYALPEGGASGFVLCGSIWAKATAARSLSIGFIDSGFGVLGSTTWSLAAGQWRRIWHTITLVTTSNIRLLIGGFGTWGTVSLSLFGAQCAPLPGPGGYQRTPGNYGLRAKCRFDTDRLELRHIGPNQTAVNLKIAEYT